MFRWASNTLESLAQTVAPPPTDPLSRLYFAGQKRDEPAIMEILQQQQQHEGIAIHPVHTIIHEVKGYTLLHLACLYSLSGLLQYCVHQMQQESPHPSYYLLVTDKEGNTPLHCAAMSNHGDALEIIKRLLSIEVEASSSSQNGSNTGNNTPPMITVQNGLRKTPYDVATVNSIRQYLLPIQLQAETQIALQNGGVGLPPGIDMGGLTIQNAAHLPPPPTSFGSGASPAAGRVSSHGGGGSMYAPIPGLNVSSTDPSVATALPVFPSSQASMYPPTTPSVMPQQPPQQEQQMYHSNVNGQYTSPLVDGNNTATAPPSNQQTGVPLPPMPVRQETQPRHLSSSSSTNEMTTPPSTIPRPPNSNGSLTGSTSSYALTGRSSAAIFSKSSKGGIQPDGFHSSSSDKNLQEKYGHVNVSNTALPPPPSSGNFTTPENLPQEQQNQYPQPLSAPPSMSGGVNPFAGGLAAATTGAFRTSARRYVTYDPMASQRPSPLPPPQQQQPQQQAASMYNQFQQPMPAQPPAQPFNPVFNGNNFPVPTQSSSVSFTIPPAPFSGSNTGGANTFSSPNSFIGKTPANTPMLSSLNTTTGITPSATTTFMSPPPSGMAASFGATTEPATVAPQSFASSSSPDRSGSGCSGTSNTAASVFGSPTTGVSVAPSAPTDRRTQSSHGYHRSNSGDAAALFSKPITTTETAMDSTPIPPPEPQEQSATHTDTTTDTINATGFTEDDDLHDVPLTPGQEATYKVNAVENDTNQPLPGNDQPPPPPLTDAVNSLITAIGMPPPPFSRK